MRSVRERSGQGGTLLRFSVGPNDRSIAHLAYISRVEAVREGREDAWLFRFPDDISAAQDYRTLQASLASYAWVRAAGERRKGGAKSRTHYRCILSYERAIPTSQIRDLTRQWLETTLPTARAAAFLHSNTAHPHIHLWIEARGVDGKKLHLSARQFRQLDEAWNRIYAWAMGRDEREHLLKKGRTERIKQLWRERGKRRDLYREGRGGYGREIRRGPHRLDRNQRGIGAESAAVRVRQSEAQRRERATAESAAGCRAANRTSDRAVSAVRGLRQAAQRLAHEAERENEMRREDRDDRER